MAGQAGTEGLQQGHPISGNRHLAGEAGGGVSGGFRFLLTADGRWSMEASLGAGVYRLDYDVFTNRHNGLIEDRRRRTFVGIDNVALSFCYRFDMKGGGR